jgi:drug/metabolite transporter (DMT)-like permease
MSLHAPAGLPLHVLLPLSSGVIYVLGAMLLKRATDLGANVWRTTRLCNFSSALLFAPLALLGGAFPGWDFGWQPLLAALLFMAGQVSMLLALNIGDVSVVTPVLGLKIPIVAVLTTVLVGERLGLGLWTAALLSSVAIALLNSTRAPSHRHVGVTILLATFAASSYALFDVLVQKWTPAWGAGRLLPATMTVVALVSLGLRPFGRRASVANNAAAARGTPWLAAGALCIGLQGMLFVSAIALYGQATVANVLYSSRGLWSVLAVWFIGHWFANREQEHGPRVLACRFIGAALLMAAILIVLLGAPRHT